MKARSHKYPDDNGIYTDTTFYDKNDKYFDLGWQRLRRLDNYNEFSYLRNLFVDHNELIFLPEPSSLPFIEQLNCSYNNLTQIPFYPKLTFLNMSHNKINSCRSYANSHLKFIDLSFNDRLNIDFRLVDCKHLYITDNKISAINVDLFPNLEFLDCSNNQIKEIQPIPTLIELNIQQNLLTELPSFPKLLRLMADHNQISILKTYPTLLSVNISHNLLTRIDSQPNLTRIQASYNQIKILGQMPKLELIELPYNSIENYEIPPTASFVSLQFNPMVNIELDSRLLSVIKELSINYITFTHFYKKYYNYFDRVEVQVNRDKLVNLLSKLNSIFDEKLTESIFKKLSELKFQDREEILFKISLKLYWKYFSTNKSIKNMTDLVNTQQFQFLHKNISKIYYKTIIVTLYFNGYY